MRFSPWLSSALVFAVVASARADPQPPGKQPSGKPSAAQPPDPVEQTALVDHLDHPKYYRFVAKWKVARPTDGNHYATSSDQLKGIEIRFGPGKKDDKIKDTPAWEDLTIKLDVSGLKPDDSTAILLRSTLLFFWEPEWEKKAGTWVLHTSGNRDKEPRFDLAPDFAKKVAGITYPSKSEDNRYWIVSQRSVTARDPWERKPNGELDPTLAGLRNTLELFRQMGEKGGRVQMLLEEKQRPHSYLIVYWPESDPWRGAKLASPGLDRIYDLDIAEPLMDLPGQKNVARLPNGTLGLLKTITERQELLAFGRNGLVIKKDSSPPEYTVHRLEGSNKNSKELSYTNLPIVTWGIAKTSPPAWMEKLQHDKWSEDQARHLVALSVCSRELWMKPRPTKHDPQASGPEHKPLPAHPELWAIPPYPSEHRPLPAHPQDRTVPSGPPKDAKR